MTGADSYSCKCTDEFEGDNCDKRKRTCDMADSSIFFLLL